MFNPMAAASQKMLTKIHDASMALLYEVGIAFHDAEALEIFRKAGFKIDGKTVYFKEKEIRNAIDSAPSRFGITARNQNNSVNIGDNDCGFAPGYGAPFSLEADGRQRPSLMADYENFCKLVHTSKLINVNGFLMVQPTDVPVETSHLDMLFSNIVLCDKPFMGSPVSKIGARDCINLAAIVWGGKKNLIEKPVTISLITPFSPFRYSPEMSGSMIEFARYGQALVFGALVLAGATGSVTLSGTLAQQNAELLSGVTLAQLVRPGTPVVIGGSSSVIDLRTGCPAMGAPEFHRLTAATLQMAKFYNLPARGGCALTDAHFHDAQAGYESALGLSTAVYGGSNFILHAVGMLGSYAEMSMEKFIIDEEICRIILESSRPLVDFDDAINIDTIKAVGIGGEFLTHIETLQHCRNQASISSIANRQGYARWHDSGQKRINEKATDVLHDRLNAYVKPDIDPQLEKDLFNYIKARKNGDRTALDRG